MPVVAPDDLAKALLVWLRVAPTSVWRDLEKYHLLEQAKRHDPSNRPDPQAALAAYLASRFEAAKWEVTHPDPTALGSPPPAGGS